MNYEGKEPCQGCGKLGSEINRYSKNELCPICKSLFEKGKRIDFEENEKFVNVRQHFFSYRPDWINISLHSILSSLNNPPANAKGYLAIKSAFGSNQKEYKVNEKYIEPLRELFLKIESEIYSVEKCKKEIPDLVRNELQSQKDKIFNEGVEKGRKLLFQLNSGDISANELNNNYSYNEKNK